ncbi:winged helix DNA-binding domain-containing protein [Streptacidiphilus rugosus]|uniref:winged helix DNA-binding domain-containing protein n=1 Tax=Streptacidiphilus rugosus TaxID=405783 RepID=UPI0005607CCD|nr:winged helix DNA-binding domain-containing protein [Streptacidiphilus rugosus]
MVLGSLDDRALNRALMARQSLLARGDRSPLETVRHLVGMQSQIPGNPYTAFWSRIADFDPAEASLLLANRETVRMSTLRGTVHLHDVEDALTLRAFTQPVHQATPYGERSVFRSQLAGVEPDALWAVARELLDAGPLATGRLGQALAERFPGYEPAALGTAVRYKFALVQVTPRGEWGRSGAATLTTVESWLGRPQREPDVAAVMLRYLAAFGPASVQDAQHWCGVTRLGEVFEKLRPQLVVFADAGTGRELFDLPDAPRPDPETPAPVRFLPDYDNVLIGHARRSRVMDEADRIGLFSNGNGYRPGLLVDGRLAGAWAYAKPKRKGAPAELTVELFGDRPAAVKEEVEAEATALLAFLAPSAASRTVRLHLGGPRA